MDKQKMNSYQKALLIFVSAGLTPIALSYGLMPQRSLDFLFGISVSSMNLEHIMRAVMGLYLAMIILWIVGAVNSSYRNPALISMIVFMFGLAAGRLISLIIDGIPHWLLIAYLACELLFGTLAMLLLRRNKIE
jgi:hypothetical protein